MTQEEIKELVALKCWAVEKTDGKLTERIVICAEINDGNFTPNREFKLLWKSTVFPNGVFVCQHESKLEVYRMFQRAYYEAVAPEPRTVTDPREQAASSPENPDNCQAKSQDPYAELLTRVERLEKMLTPHVERKEVDTSCQINKDYYTK